MNKQLATKNDEQQFDPDIAVLAQLADELIGFAGTPLRFVKGKWLTGREDASEEVGATQTFCFDVRSYAHGWIKWQKQKPVHKIIGRPIDGFRLPSRTELGDLDENAWPQGRKGPEDPWQRVAQISVREADFENCPPLVFSSPSVGARIGLGHFLKAYAAGAKDHPGLMPVVLLKSVDRDTEYGRMPTPKFEIVDWADFGEGAAPPGSPMPQPALPQPAAPAMKFGGGEVAAVARR